MSRMYGSYSDADLNDWERFPLNANVLTSSAFGAWLMRRDERRDKCKLEQIRAEIESKLQGVNTTLDVLVKDDALIPTMKTAKTTLEEVLDIIDKALKEQTE